MDTGNCANTTKQHDRTWILLSTCIVLVLWMQHAFETRLPKQRQDLKILQVPRANQVSVDMLMEKVPIVVCSELRNCFAMSLLFPWSSTANIDHAESVKVTSNLALIRFRESTYADVSQPGPSSVILRVLMDPTKTLILPRYYTFSCASNANVTYRYSSICLVHETFFAG
jgi:hypothetical protein